MSRQRHFLDIDVLEAARQRIETIYDLFDSVAVMFSGGKDSLVCLELIRQFHEKNGLGRVKVVFRDEELLPNSVIDFVDGYRKKSWVDMDWWCIPQVNNRFVLGRHLDYVQWDPKRKWVRQKPPWAISPDMVGGQHENDILTSQGMRGKAAFIVGIRAQESLTRYRSVVNKLNLNYICASSTPKVKLCKPIYDWSEDDVFKFFMEEKVDFCEIYRAQNLSGAGLRVSTPLHVEAAKRIDLVKHEDPDFYQRLVDVFPETLLQDRYWREWDVKAQREKYGGSFRGCWQYIEDHIPPGRMKDLAKKRLKEFKTMSKKNPEAFNPQYLLKHLTSGAIERVIQGEYKV